MAEEEQTAEVVVLGAGSGGQPVAETLAAHGADVAVVERHRVGGECPYVACIPSKALLLAAAADARWDQAVRRRDRAADDRDDADTARGLLDAGARLLRGTGTVTGPGRVDVVLADGGRVRLRWTRALVVATGSAPVMPPVAGLDEVPTWTSADALSASDRPDRLVVLGGGAVGCELAQAFARLGSHVELVEVAPRLLGAEQPWVGDLVATALREDGVRVHVDTEASRVERAGNGVRLHRAGGGTVEGDRLLLAGGRRPRGDRLGLETLGIRPEDGAVRVDDRCRALGAGGPLDDVFAVGDVTAVAPYTHTASYQAEVVADVLRGHDRVADYRAIPRVVYTDPSVFCVGATRSGTDGKVLTAVFDVGGTARAFIERPAVPGRLELFADQAGVVVGAALVAPAAESWGGELALAVRARLTAGLLADHVHPHPSWSETVHPAARRLAELVAGGGGTVVA